MLWLKCVRWPMLVVLDVIVVAVPNASFDCWFGLFFPEPGDIFSASVSNELSMFSVSLLWWIIWLRWWTIRFFFLAFFPSSIWYRRSWFNSFSLFWFFLCVYAESKRKSSLIFISTFFLFAIYKQSIDIDWFFFFFYQSNVSDLNDVRLRLKKKLKLFILFFIYSLFLFFSLLWFVSLKTVTV